MVNGDLFPCLVNDYCDIYNLVLHSYNWPEQWKTESVTIIAKTSTVSTSGEYGTFRVHTLLFSKVLESYMMGRINAEVKIDTRQYGRVKKCRTKHLLIQAWNNILQGLEDNRESINLITIDFAKAFNRMSHQSCVFLNSSCLTRF